MKNKKKYVSLLTALLTATMIFALAPVPVKAAEADDGIMMLDTDEDTLVTNDENGIADKLLYKVILESVRKNDPGVGESFTVQQAKNVRYISYGGTEGEAIDSFAGIEVCENLESVSLWNVTVADFSALSELKNLTSLALYGDKISDISALSKFTNLTALSMHTNEISDISALSNLTNLTSLTLSGNKISNVSALEGLTNLNYLQLSENEISDISALSGLKNLTDLKLYRNSISNINALSGLENLTILYVSDNQISDVSGLSNLKKLSSLDLDRNAVSNISALSGLTNLTYLGMRNNDITDISALTNLTNLKNLDLSANKISKITTLKNLTNLTDLTMSDNGISDIRALSELTNLTSILMSNNKISDISALAGLTNLKTLWMGNNHISDISALAGKTKLTNLILSDNHITDASPLEGLSVTINLVAQKAVEEDCPGKNPPVDDEEEKENPPQNPAQNGTPETSNTITSNGDKNVSVSGAESVLPEGATFTTKELTEGEGYENTVYVVTAELGKDAVYSVFKMDLNDADGNAMTQLNGYVQVSLPVPENLSVPEGKTIVVYRCENDGTLTKCKTTVKDGIVTFETNHFSYYVLNVEDKEIVVTPDSPTYYPFTDDEQAETKKQVLIDTASPKVVSNKL